MSKLLMLQDSDFQRLNQLQKKSGFKTKIGIFRHALDLFEAKMARVEKLKRWKNVVKRLAKEDIKIFQEFEKSHWFKKS